MKFNALDRHRLWALPAVLVIAMVSFGHVIAAILREEFVGASLAGGALLAVLGLYMNYVVVARWLEHEMDRRMLHRGIISDHERREFIERHYEDFMKGIRHAPR